MYEIDLYLEVSSKKIRSGKAYAAYVLEWKSQRNGIKTLCEAICTEATGNRLVLAAAVRALGRICKESHVTVHTDLQYLASAFEMGWLDAWRKNAWRTAKGQEIKNRDIWEEMAMYADRHHIEVRMERKHQYSNWMKSEMRSLDLDIGETMELKPDETAERLNAGAL